jgi:hypothetical protein
MKARITVGEVELRLDGTDLTYPQIKALLRAATTYAVTLTMAAKDNTDEPPAATSLGFTAHLELDPGRHEPHNPPLYDDEDEEPV